MFTLVKASLQVEPLLFQGYDLGLSACEVPDSVDQNREYILIQPPTGLRHRWGFDSRNRMFQPFHF